jgi:hypothetical protein
LPQRQWSPKKLAPNSGSSSGVADASVKALESPRRCGVGRRTVRAGFHRAKSAVGYSLSFSSRAQVRCTQMATTRSVEPGGRDWKCSMTSRTAFRSSDAASGANQDGSPGRGAGSKLLAQSGRASRRDVVLTGLPQRRGRPPTISRRDSAPRLRDRGAKSGDK